MSITLLTNIGNVGTTGQTVSIDPSIEADLVRRGAAQYVSQVGLNIDPVVRAVTNPVTGGNRFSEPNSLAVYSAARNRVRGIMADLSQGRSTSMFLMGDSTGNEPSEWFYRMAEPIASLLPSCRIEYKVWSDATKDYGATTVIQAGTAGERWIGAGNVIPSADAAEWVDDLDLRVKINHATWLPASSECLLSKFSASAGQRSFRWEKETSGGAPRMVLRWTADGSTELVAISSTFTQDAATDHWLRVTLDVDNGSGGYTVTFYRSSDGVAWTQINQIVTTSGTTSVFKGSAAWEAGSRSNNGTSPLTGKVYKADARAGIDGYPLLPASIDEWRPIIITPQPQRGGSPTLYMINGSHGGAGLSYFATNAAKLIPRFTAGKFYISTGHNETWTTTRADIATAITNIRTRIPYADGYAVLQNPRIAPSTQTTAYLIFAQIFGEIAQRNGLGVCDVYRAFSESADIAALIGADGIHPTAAGATVWRDAVFNASF